MSKETTLYLTKADQSNTREVLEVAKQYSESHNIQTILVASTRGQTAIDACKVFPPGSYNLVIVTSHAGFHAPGELYLSSENRKQIEMRGAKLLIASHALSGVERSVRKALGTWMPLELFAMVLRLFGEGTKVCVEITVMAADAHLIPMDGTDIIAIGGSGGGRYRVGDRSCAF